MNIHSPFIDDQEQDQDDQTLVAGCRCAKKTRGFIAAGYVDPKKLLCARERMLQVREVARAKADALASLDDPIIAREGYAVPSST